MVPCDFVMPSDLFLFDHGRWLCGGSLLRWIPFELEILQASLRTSLAEWLRRKRPVPRWCLYGLWCSVSRRAKEEMIECGWSKEHFVNLKTWYCWCDTWPTADTSNFSNRMHHWLQHLWLKVDKIPLDFGESVLGHFKISNDNFHCLWFHEDSLTNQDWINHRGLGYLLLFLIDH